MDDTICEGNHVLLMKKFDSDNMKIIPVIKESIVHYGKLHFDPTPLIGSKFGSVFAIEDKTMIEVENFEAYDDELSTTVANNLETFNEKSKFSQEKIIKKKKKRSYANVVTALRPTLMHLNELLYARNKLGGLRCDSLAQILTSANIQNGSKCLLLDHNLGLLTAAVMSRVLPDGICVQMLADIEASYTTRKTLEMLNITEEKCIDKIFAITIRDIYKVHCNEDSFQYENDIMKARGEEHLDRLAEAEDHMVRNPETGEKTRVKSSASDKEELYQVLTKKDTNREIRNSERMKASFYLKSQLIDSIIMIAQHDHPLQLLKITYPFLAPSRQFVIYSDTIEPLLECHRYLKVNQLAVSLNLSESWLRRYQVLPDRTRPEMNMSGCGGYLLSGTKAHFSLPA